MIIKAASLLVESPPSSRHLYTFLTKKQYYDIFIRHSEHTCSFPYLYTIGKKYFDVYHYLYRRLLYTDSDPHKVKLRRQNTAHTKEQSIMKTTFILCPSFLGGGSHMETGMLLGQYLVSSGLYTTVCILYADERCGKTAACTGIPRRVLEHGLYNNPTGTIKRWAEKGVVDAVMVMVMPFECIASVCNDLIGRASWSQVSHDTLTILEYEVV